MSIKQRLGNFLFRIANKLNKSICIEKSDYYYSKDGKREMGRKSTPYIPPINY